MTGRVSDYVPGLVSVIVPVFNRPAALREAVESALGQSYSTIEILVVDDGSTDGTAEVASALVRQSPGRVRAINRPNGGPGQARESGRQAARGEFLQYLDSDDLLLPRKLELQVAALRARPECGIAYGICRELHSDGTPSDRPLRPSDRPIEAIFPTFLLGCFWNTLVPLYRAELCERAGPWSELRVEEDWELDARIGALAPRLAFVPEPLAVQRNHLPERLSERGLHPEALRDRARASESILASARRTGIGAETPEMRQYARSLFLLARQCGSAGLAGESRRLFELARSASTPRASAGPDFRLYRLAATLFGWKVAARVSGALERLRP
ncbi:MAG: glycosyltransferase family 2 protein [Myxococcota bacterium]